MKTQNLEQKNGVIDSESKGNYSHENPIKFLTSLLESNLYNYSDVYVLVTENITATPNNFINITMPMWNLIECSDNYSDTSGSLWDFKRDEIMIMQM